VKAPPRAGVVCLWVRGCFVLAAEVPAGGAFKLGVGDQPQGGEGAFFERAHRLDAVGPDDFGRHVGGGVQAVGGDLLRVEFLGEVGGEHNLGEFALAEGIAERAGVGKETLYRWWRSKTEVLLEALGEYGEQAIPIPATGSLARDLTIFMRETSAALDPPTRRILRTLAAAAAADTGAASKVRDQFLARRRAALAAVLQPARDRGELPAEPTIATLLDLVFGSLWYRLIFSTGPLDQDWADAVASAITSTACPAHGLYD
jgi:AcrR family transcriptional regulator